VTIPESTRQRLRFLTRVVSKEAKHLTETNERLFATAFTAERAAALQHDPDLAERVDAFVSRFGRLQDTVGDKLLPTLLSALGENPAPKIDMLDRAERLGLIASSEQWMQLRRLRNQMIHEYVEDPKVLADALEAAHAAVAALVRASQSMTAEIARRGWQ
jgi:hypothetical protein